MGETAGSESANTQRSANARPRECAERERSVHAKSRLELQIVERRYDAKREAILESLREGNTRKAAAGAAGIHRDTLYAWLADPAFSDSVTIAEAEAERRNVGFVQAAARGEQVIRRKVTRFPDGREIYEEWLSPRDWKAAAWWLERRQKWQWNAQQTLDVTKLDDDQIVRLLENEAAEGVGEAENPPA